jgi:hypothetical protein
VSFHEFLHKDILPGKIEKAYDQRANGPYPQYGDGECHAHPFDGLKVTGHIICQPEMDHIHIPGQFPVRKKIGQETSCDERGHHNPDGGGSGFDDNGDHKRYAAHDERYVKGE